MSLRKVVPPLAAVLSCYADFANGQRGSEQVEPPSEYTGADQATQLEDYVETKEDIQGQNKAAGIPDGAIEEGKDTSGDGEEEDEDFDFEEYFDDDEDYYDEEEYYD